MSVQDQNGALVVARGGTYAPMQVHGNHVVHQALSAESIAAAAAAFEGMGGMEKAKAMAIVLGTAK